MLKSLNTFLAIFSFIFLMNCYTEYDLNEMPNVIDYPQSYEKLDILLVLDNSGSMWGDWEYISYGLAQIPEELNDFNIDWKIAITSMDDSDRSWVEVPHSDDPGWKIIEKTDEFREVGGGAEEGFNGALRAKFEHPEFFREDVVTLIIFVSDEHEQSDLTPAEFHSQWKDKHIVASIVGPEFNEDEEEARISEEFVCAEAAPKYHAASQIVIDICTVSAWSIIDQVVE